MSRSNAIHIDKVTRYTPFHSTIMSEAFPTPSIVIENVALLSAETLATTPEEHHTFDLPGTTNPTLTDEHSVNIDTTDTVLTTCKQLLVKLEEIRTSVLHLQYSIHAGELGTIAVDNRDRAQQLWSWDKGGAFSAEISSGFIHGTLDNVFNAGFPDIDCESVDTESDKSGDENLFGATNLDVIVVPDPIATADLFAVDSPDTAISTADAIDTNSSIQSVSIDPSSPTDVTSSGL
jgi:hypothetical protein